MITRVKKVDNSFDVLQDKLELSGYKLCMVPAHLISDRNDSVFVLQTGIDSDKVQSTLSI